MSRVSRSPVVTATLLPVSGELYAKAFGIGILAFMSFGFLIRLFLLSLSTISCRAGSSEALTSFTRYMASMRYGAMSHWIMLKMTTMKGRNSMLTPARDKMIVKKSVDKPMIRASVPSNEKRSFHKLTSLSSVLLSKSRGLYPLLFQVLLPLRLIEMFLVGVTFRLMDNPVKNRLMAHEESLY